MSANEPQTSNRTGSRPSVAGAVRSYVNALAAGQAFSVRELLTLGPRASVDQALSRLHRSGELERPARGVYAKPRINRTLGRKVPTAPAQVIEAITRSSGAKVSIGGAEAARRLGFSTQVPMRSVYATTGRSRRLRLPTGEVVLRHAAPSRMELAGTPAGDALAALLYLGRNEVTPSTVASVRSALSMSEFAALKAHASAMPGWLSDTIHRTSVPVASPTPLATFA